MQDKWYIAIEDKPIGPFNKENIENMLKNRTIHFVDFIWKVGGNSWERVFKAEIFNHLLPKKPLINMETEKSAALNIENIESFIEKSKLKEKIEKEEIKEPPKAFEENKGKVNQPIEQKHKQISNQRAVLSAPPKVVEEPPLIISFVADVIVHDSLKVYHAVAYGISKNAIYLACKSKHLPVKRKLEILISSNELNSICSLNGEVSSVSKFSPIGYCISVESMPDELMKIAAG